MVKAKRLLRGLGMTSAVLLAASITTGAIMEQYPAPLDALFDTLSSKVVSEKRRRKTGFSIRTSRPRKRHSTASKSSQSENRTKRSRYSKTATRHCLLQRTQKSLLWACAVTRPFTATAAAVSPTKRRSRTATR